MPGKPPQTGPTSPLSTQVRAWMATLPESLAPVAAGSPQAGILAAARARFATDGFRGTTTRSIAEEAGVNLAMLHYYFGDKTHLYRRVLAGEILGFFMEIAEDLSRAEDTPGRSLVTLPDAIVKSMRSTPDRLGLLRRELGAGAPHLLAVVHSLGPAGPLGFRELILSLAARARTQGELNRTSPEVVLLFLIVHAHGLLFAEPLLRTIFGHASDAPDFLDDALDAQRALLERALLAERPKERS